MILKFHNFFDRIFRLFSSFLQQKKLPTSRCGLRKKKRVPSCFFSNQISKYPGYPGINLGIPLPRTNNHKKKYQKRKENHLHNFQSSLSMGSFFSVPPGMFWHMIPPSVSPVAPLRRYLPGPTPGCCSWIGTG